MSKIERTDFLDLCACLTHAIDLENDANYMSTYSSILGYIVTNFAFLGTCPVSGCDIYTTRYPDSHKSYYNTYGR